jgi:signal peptidase I
VTSNSGGTSPEGRPNDEAIYGRLVVPADDAADAHVPHGATASRSPARKPLPLWQEAILLVGIAVVLALLLKTFFLQAFYIPSGSMRHTLEINDRILVQKVSYWFGDVERGDIVVFDDPAHWLGEEDGAVASNIVTKAMSFVGLYPSGGHLVKRVVGVGGDSVACRRGDVSVNGVTLDEAAYVTLAPQACDGRWKVEVPADALWVLGDNRQNSADSRAHLGDPGGGFIPVADVVGKAFVVVWPLDRWQFLPRPGAFGEPALTSGPTSQRQRQESLTATGRGGAAVVMTALGTQCLLPPRRRMAAST